MKEKENENPAIRTIVVKLDDKELRDRADALVAAMTDHETIEAEKKAAVTVYNERLTATDEVIQKLKHSIETRSEERPIECLAEPDYRASKMKYLHPDTKEVLGERDLDPSEYQTEIGGSKAAPSDPPDPWAEEGKQEFPAGVCRFCGCDEKTPCIIEDAEGRTQCGWISESVRTACTRPECVANWRELADAPAPDAEPPLPANVLPMTKPTGKGKKKGGKKTTPSTSAS